MRGRCAWAAAAVLAAGLAGWPSRAEEVVCFEAESATNAVAPVRVCLPAAEASDAWPHVKGASCDAYLEVPQGAGNPPKVTAGEARYAFEVKEGGTYVLWVRAWWADGCGNSIGASVDGGAPFTFGQDATYNAWHWVRSPPALRQLELSKGIHTLVILNREDGVRLDQVLFVNAKRYVPVEIEDVTAPRRAHSGAAEP